MITFELTPKMYSLILQFQNKHRLSVTFKSLHTHPNAAVKVEAEEEDAKRMLAFYTKIVNGISAYMNTDPDHTSALAAIKRIRKALGLKGMLEGAPSSKKTRTISYSGSDAWVNEGPTQTEKDVGVNGYDTQLDLFLYDDPEDHGDK